MASDWIAITGGCGYVGSHIASAIKLHTKFKTLVIDARASKNTHTHDNADELIDDDFVSESALKQITKLKPKAVIHCAASSLVTPSMTDPAAYYDNNVVKMKRLLDHLITCEHKNLVFSSSSSVYGDGDGETPNTEYEPLGPISPYGKTKMIGEMILHDYYMAYGLNSIAFRYFNAVGAQPNGNIGQEPGATHLIARIMESMLLDEALPVYGSDYPTRDGTCVRDYVHVNDIAWAHVMGMSYLLNHPGQHVYNIGSGKGYSVLEIIAAVEKVTGKKVNKIMERRRPGDPAWRVADTSRITADLGWKPMSELDQIVADAYRWYNSDTFKNITR